jgi:hypothetical protein
MKVAIIRTGRWAGFATALAPKHEVVVGTRDREDPMLVSVSLWAAVHGITSLLISKPGFPWPDLDLVVGQVVRTALFGIVPRA